MSLNVSAHVWVHEAMGPQKNLCSCAHAWQCFRLYNVSQWAPMDFFTCQLISLGSCTFTSGSLPLLCTDASLHVSVCMLVFWCPHRSICGSLNLCSRGPCACLSESMCLNPFSRHQPQKVPASPPPPLTAVE